MAWMVVLLGVVLGMVLGWRCSRHREVRINTDIDLSRHGERLRYTRNRGMRMHELAQNQLKLEEEQIQLAQLRDLKKGVATLLMHTQRRMNDASNTDVDLERLETLLAATSKSLRLLLEVGANPQDFDSGRTDDVLAQLDKTFSLVAPKQWATKIQNKGNQSIVSQSHIAETINQYMNQFSPELDASIISNA